MGLGSLKMLLIIEPLDNHLAEFAYIVCAGGGEDVCPVGCGEILPIGAKIHAA